MLLGYVTNGFAHHALADALRILADVGYRSVAITLDRCHLDPFDDDWPRNASRVRELLRACDLRCTIETGARFLLDPRRKHQPTMISADADDRGRRVAYLCRAIDIAAELDADSVSLWSGAADDDSGDGIRFDRLCSSLADVLSHAERCGMPIAFEPEPGMFIERMADFERLYDAVDHTLFGLTLDIGHVHCLGDGDLVGHVRQWRDKLLNVHIEDMRRATHEHLLFGDGEINFTEAIGVLSSVGYRGPVHVELSRHSHDAPAVAARAYEFLSALWLDGRVGGSV